MGSTDSSAKLNSQLSGFMETMLEKKHVEPMRNSNVSNRGPLRRSELARKTVLSVLGRPEVARIGFTFLDHRIPAGILRDALRGVQLGLIEVLHDTSKNGFSAEYDFRGNRLLLGREYAAHPFQQALVVHESMHAACDVRKLRGQNDAVSESIAYVAQQMFNLLVAFEHDDGHRGDPILREIFDASAMLANSAVRGEKLYRGECWRLMLAINRCPIYRDAIMRPRICDGV